MQRFLTLVVGALLMSSVYAEDAPLPFDDPSAMPPPSQVHKVMTPAHASGKSGATHAAKRGKAHGKSHARKQGKGHAVNASAKPAGHKQAKATAGKAPAHAAKKPTRPAHGAKAKKPVSSRHKKK